MNYKAKLEHDLSIVNMVAVIVGLAAIVASIILHFTIGSDNVWTELTYCIALICVVEACYSGGYLKGLSYKDITNNKDSKNKDKE